MLSDGYLPRMRRKRRNSRTLPPILPSTHTSARTFRVRPRRTHSSLFDFIPQSTQHTPISVPLHPHHRPICAFSRRRQHPEQPGRPEVIHFRLYIHTGKHRSLPPLSELTHWWEQTRKRHKILAVLKHTSLDPSILYSVSPCGDSERRRELTGTGGVPTGDRELSLVPLRGKRHNARGPSSTECADGLEPSALC